MLICGGLIAIIWAIFGRTLGYDFINYDDSFYVYQNSFISNGLTRAGIIRAFTNPLVGNWHPLTSFSLMSDAQMFGLHPGGYHLVNVILHTTVVLLLFFVLRAMTGARWRSAFVAAVFAIHPLRAESVVWISERKDVLSGVFFLLCLLAYVRYARKVSWGRYALVFLALALGLMAKAMLVTVPFLLLLLDYWPLRRFSFAPPVQTDEPPAWPTRSIAWLFLEKVPLLALAIGISAATIWSQEPALKAAQNWTFSGRIGNALVSFWIYLRQMVWPVHLAIFYPHPKGALPMIMVGAAAFALVVMTSAILVSRKKCPYLVTGWFWYLGMLVPVIGLLQVGWQAHADRYTYLPQIGIAIMVAWGLADLTANWRQRTVPLASAATVVLLLLLAVSWRQVGYWSDSIGLWRHTLAVTENNDVAERGLGTALLQAGQVDEAIVHDRNALRIRPGDVNGQTNLANALLRKKELPEAIALYRQVIERRPNDSEMHRNLAKALYQNGATDESVAEFREALRLRPNDSDAAYSLGNAFLEQGRVEEAIPFFKKAIASNQKKHRSSLQPGHRPAAERARRSRHRAVPAHPASRSSPSRSAQQSGHRLAQERGGGGCHRRVEGRPAGSSLTMPRCTATLVSRCFKRDARRTRWRNGRNPCVWNRTWWPPKSPWPGCFAPRRMRRCATAGALSNWPGVPSQPLAMAT